MYEFQNPTVAQKPPSKAASFVGKGAGIAASAATTAAVVAGTALASKAATAVQAASAAVGGSTLAVQAPSHLETVSQGISAVDDAAGVLDAIPPEAEEISFDGISELFDQKDAVGHLSDGVQELTSSPAYDQPAITGLRKSK
jgi:hypothetical protein